MFAAVAKCMRKHSSAFILTVAIAFIIISLIPLTTNFPVDAVSKHASKEKIPLYNAILSSEFRTALIVSISLASLCLVDLVLHTILHFRTSARLIILLWMLVLTVLLSALIHISYTIPAGNYKTVPFILCCRFIIIFGISLCLLMTCGPSIFDPTTIIPIFVMVATRSTISCVEAYWALNNRFAAVDTIFVIIPLAALLILEIKWCRYIYIKRKLHGCLTVDEWHCTGYSFLVLIFFGALFLNASIASNEFQGGLVIGRDKTYLSNNVYIAAAFMALATVLNGHGIRKVLVDYQVITDLNCAYGPPNLFNFDRSRNMLKKYGN